MKRILLAGAILFAAAQAQFGLDDLEAGDEPDLPADDQEEDIDDGDDTLVFDDEDEPEDDTSVPEVPEVPEEQEEQEELPPGVNPISAQIVKQDKICEKDFVSQMKNAPLRVKIQFAQKTRAMMRDVMIMAQESTYTAAENAYRKQKCEDESDEMKPRCEKAIDQLFNVSDINYITFRGKRAFDAMCAIQSQVPSCKTACDLMHEFFGEPTAADCDMVKEEWKNECQARASGNLVYGPISPQDMKQLHRHVKRTRECTFKHNQARRDCANRLQKHLDFIIEKSGKVPKSAHADVSKCFYKSLRNFAKCVKRAPAKPLGTSADDFHRAAPKRKQNRLQDIMNRLASALGKVAGKRLNVGPRRPPPTVTPVTAEDLLDDEDDGLN